MGTGWRKAFCTSIPRDNKGSIIIDNSTHKQQQQQQQEEEISPVPSTPRSFSKLGAIFSSGGSSSSTNPSTPRLRCKTTTRSSSFTSSKDCIVTSPKLRCKTTPNTPTSSKSSKITPKLATTILSNPSSPRSPFSIFKTTLRLSRNNCGVCLQSVKTGQRTAVFTAECSHLFHFHCIAGWVRKQSCLFCPVCNTAWKYALPLFPPIDHQQQDQPEIYSPKKIISLYDPQQDTTYNDDEPLPYSGSSSRDGGFIIPIPEVIEDVEEFKGFFVNPVSSSSTCDTTLREVEMRLLPEVAIVAVGPTHEVYAVVLKVKAPPQPVQNSSSCVGRAPIDLVAVLDVGGRMTRKKLEMMKRAMHLVISSLSFTDRLSIISFAAAAKRLMPLKRMTVQGQQFARRIIDQLDLHKGSSAGDALRQATKILEDRRERNPVATVMLLSEGQDHEQQQQQQQQQQPPSNQHYAPSSTRFAHVEIPVVQNSPTQDGFAKCVGGLLSVVVQDLRIQIGFAPDSDPAEISAVYLSNGRPTVVSSSSRSTIRLGDLYAEEERELLLELRVPVAGHHHHHHHHHVLSVSCSYKKPATQERINHRDHQPMLIPQAQIVRSSGPKIQRLRDLFVTTRAIAESRKLIEQNHELESAQQLLVSTRDLLVQSPLAHEYIASLDAELSENLHAEEQRRRRLVEPQSASTIRKYTRRVSDLHGFENARF